MKLTGIIRIEFHHKDTLQETRSPLTQTNLIFDQTYLAILGSTPNPVFSNAAIYISGQTTAPQLSDTNSTDVLAEGFVPGSVTSPVWYESVEPNFGEIINQINAPGVDRTFYTVGLKTGSTFWCATLLSIPCTQQAFEVLTIYYKIQVQNTAGERLTSRFTRDFGGALFARKTCNHLILSTSYCNPPTQEYTDAFIGVAPSEQIISLEGFGQRFAWDDAEIVDSHYKYKESLTCQIAQSFPPGIDQNIGWIFNAMLTGSSNSLEYSAGYVGGNYTENTSSVYRISRYTSKTINIDPLKPVFQPPFQKIWSHRASAPLPFFDPINTAIGSNYPEVGGAWQGKWPELYRYTITTDTGDYKFSKRLHLGFNGNTYSDRVLSNPFRNPNTPAAPKMHGWRNEDNDLLRFSDTQIVQYDATGVTLLDLMSGNYSNWDATTTPVLSVTSLRQCAVDVTNKLIYCACRDTGLWIINVTSNTTIQQVPTPCYGVDVGRNNVAYAIFNGFLSASTNWLTNLPFTYTGLTDSNWSRALFLKADPEHISDRLAIVMNSPDTPNRRVIWYEGTTSTSYAGLDDSNINQWAASLDVSDTGSFWATAGLRLNFGDDSTGAIASPPTQSINHSVWGNVNLYKIAFYNQYLITNTAIVDTNNTFINNYAEIGTTGAIIHLQGGITVFTNFLRQLFTDNNYCWENYGWDGSNWVLDNVNPKPTHSTTDALIQGLTIKWVQGADAPFSQSGDFFTQGILNGTWKDNATTVYYENFWYTKAVHFDEVLPSGLTVPLVPPYEIPFPAASNPVFLRIETDSLNELNKFTLNGIVIASLYANGETPGPNEITIVPTTSSARAIFNSADVGKTWGGTYTWIEV